MNVKTTNVTQKTQHNAWYKACNIMLQYVWAFLLVKRMFNFLETFLKRFSKRSAAVNKCTDPALLVHKQCIHGKCSEEFR